MTNYRETRAYLDSLNKYGSVLGLESMKALLEQLGNPQDNLQFVHIAGTNGKGSVLAFVSSILTCAGYRTGCYISPSVFSYREKIQVNGEYIDKESLVCLTKQVKTACENLKAEGHPHPTIFEVETALAFLYFVQEKCEIVVLETGLGGLMDATNVITHTAAAVLTSISMDHMGILGNTIEEIARQKAGIMKSGCRVVCMQQEEKVMAVIEKEAAEKHCILSTADKVRLEDIRYGLEYQTFTYTSQAGYVYSNCGISQAGTYQIENAMLAIEVTEALDGCGFSVTEEALRRGLLNMRWPGRFSVIQTDPLVILDGAHNQDGALRLAQSVETYLKGRKVIGILGVFADKEYEKIVRITVPLMEQIITIQTPDNPRALDAQSLKKTAEKYHADCICSESIKEAVELACQRAEQYKKDGEQAAIVAFGSLSHLKELYHTFYEKSRERGTF